MSEVGKCLICARPAKGTYYKVVACAGCRTFYERSIRNKSIYKCRGHGECDIENIKYRNDWCRACRHRKWETFIVEALGDKPISQLRRVKDAKNPRGRRRRAGTAASNAHVNSADSAEMDFYVASVTQHLKSTSWEKSGVIASTNRDHYVPVFETWSREEHNALRTGDYVRPNLSQCLTSLRQNMLPTKIRNNTYKKFLSNENDSDLNPMARTYFAVGTAMEISFGDQLSEWANYMADALKYQSTMFQPETDLNSMLIALRSHYSDVFRRMLLFRDLIPGFGELDSDAKRAAGVLHWKSFLASVIHHAPFSTNEDTYFTVGPNRIRNCRYWKQKKEITNWPFQLFIYKISNFIRDIGLNEVERYLLIACILLEPETDSSPNIPLSILHRHYTGVLVHAIEQRCSDTGGQTIICRKLENFFGLLGDATVFFTKHNDLPGACPPIYQSIRQQVNLLQAESSGTDDGNKEMTRIRIAATGLRFWGQEQA